MSIQHVNPQMHPGMHFQSLKCRKNTATLQNYPSSFITKLPKLVSLGIYIFQALECISGGSEGYCVLYDQDTSDHDKRQKPAISGNCLHWNFLNILQWIFALSSGSLCNSVGSHHQTWRTAQSPVTSLAVVLFSVPI